MKNTNSSSIRNRREFLKAGSIAALGITLPGVQQGTPEKKEREKLRLGVIGVGGRGGANLAGVSHEHIAALVDVDTRRLNAAKKRFPDAAGFQDFREMIEKSKLDAVVVSTPDHTHAAATAFALRRGLHVYCEKPLTHTVHEARVIRALAKEKGLVTQMGTQIHAMENYRRVVEWIQAGVLGKIQDVYVICSKSWGGAKLPEKSKPCPKELDWDLWLGPAEAIPYRDGLHPASWRMWWDFGGGTLADMACHYVDLVHWALDLGLPEGVRASGPAPDPKAAPRSMQVAWQHRAKGKRGPVTVHWNDGGKRPKVFQELGLEKWHNGVLFVGEEGWLVSDYSRHVIGPEKFRKELTTPERSIPKSIGHHREWTEAIRKGGKTTCSFDYSGRLSECVLLGVVAYRGQTDLIYDETSGKLMGRGAEDASPFLSRKYRKGWQL